MADNIILKKVKLDKNGSLELVLSIKEPDGTLTDATQKHKTPIHKDLKIAFEKLAIHAGFLIGFSETKKFKDFDKIPIDLWEDFKISQYSIGGDEGDEGVTVTGHKILGNGKAFNFNSPFYRFEEKEESRYKFMPELQSAIESIESEVYQYLDGSKVGESPQGKIEFPEEGQEADEAK